MDQTIENDDMLGYLNGNLENLVNVYDNTLNLELLENNNVLFDDDFLNFLDNVDIHTSYENVLYIEQPEAHESFGANADINDNNTTIANYYSNCDPENSDQDQFLTKHEDEDIQDQHASLVEIKNTLVKQDRKKTRQLEKIKFEEKKLSAGLIPSLPSSKRPRGAPRATIETPNARRLRKSREKKKLKDETKIAELEILEEVHRKLLKKSDIYEKKTILIKKAIESL